MSDYIEDKYKYLKKKSKVLTKTVIYHLIKKTSGFNVNLSPDVVTGVTKDRHSF